MKPTELQMYFVKHQCALDMIREQMTDISLPKKEPFLHYLLGCSEAGSELFRLSMYLQSRALPNEMDTMSFLNGSTKVSFFLHILLSLTFLFQDIVSKTSEEWRYLLEIFLSGKKYAYFTLQFTL